MGGVPGEEEKRTRNVAEKNLKVQEETKEKPTKTK